MKYIDRTKIGLEMFLGQLSPLTSATTTESPENISKEMQLGTYTAQVAECRRIQGGLRRLISSRYNLKDTIPARVRMVAESQFTPSADRMVPVFRWAQNLQRENAQARVRWLYALNDATAALCEEAKAFLRSSSELAAQRVSVLPEENAVVLTVPDSLWGQISLRFTGIDPAQIPKTPVFGYLFWAEADRCDDKFEFRLTIDTEFSDTPYHERLLQSKNWQEVTFCCASVESSVRYCNYTARVEACGAVESDAMLLCLSELLRKHALLGTQSLSGPEHHLVGLATLFGALGLVPNVPVSSGNLPPMLKLMENRYQLTQCVRMLERLNTAFCTGLAELLEEAADHYDNEELMFCRKILDVFCEKFREAQRDGQIRPLASSVLCSLREGTAAYTHSEPFAAHYNDTRCRIEATVLPLLEKHGFTGTFPHYRRLHGKRAEYISFTTDTAPTATADGSLLIHYAVAAAYCRTVTEADKLQVLGQPHDIMCAPCFVYEQHKDCRFGQVFHPAQDGKRCTFVYRYSAQPEAEQYERTAAQLTEAVQLVIQALNNKPLPAHYKPHSKENLRSTQLFMQLFDRSLLFGVPFASAVVLLFHRMLLNGPWSMLALAAAALSAGLIVVLLVTLVRFLLLRRTIWQR